MKEHIKSWIVGIIITLTILAYFGGLGYAAYEYTWTPFFLMGWSVGVVVGGLIMTLVIAMFVGMEPNGGVLNWNILFMFIGIMGVTIGSFWWLITWLISFIS